MPDHTIPVYQLTRPRDGVFSDPMGLTAKHETKHEITGTQDLEPSDRATLKFLHRHAGNSSEALDLHTQDVTGLRNSLDRIMAVTVTLKGIS